ncbi:hypothetical protein [Mesorhizobium sp. M0802]|uniref:hypothetical protein n=1 Tax=Mesorhizobium sp. M0802 TaxID=2957001 RepID=UPI00333C9F63
MRKVMVSPCQPDHIFTMCDPDLPGEAEFEAITLRAFGCMYPQYQCVVFGGRFLYEGEQRKPDLAMIARDRSHWFVVEVELVSHSLEGHVLPQVRAFRYGEPQSECAMILSRELGIDLGDAATLISRVPRAVVVVANRSRVDWEHAIRALQGQLVVVTRFAGPTGREAFEVAGSLAAIKESLGFGTYSSQDAMIRFATNIGLPDGQIQMEGVSGVTSLWKVIRDERWAWVVKDTGRLDVPDGAHVQLIRAIDGRITLRV